MLVVSYDAATKMEVVLVGFDAPALPLLVGGDLVRSGVTVG